MRAFSKNYLYELPEDILVLIYKKAFKETLASIEDMREALDNYDRLVEYIKNNHFDPYKTRAIWSIKLCYRRDVGDPYHKYSLYYADAGCGADIDFLRLNKKEMTRDDEAFSSIKYLDFPIYPIKDRVSTESYNSCKMLLEEYARFNLSCYPNITGIVLGDDKIRLEYADAASVSVFKCYIDIYNIILEGYNFIVYIFNIINQYYQLYPVDNLEFMDDLNDLREWFEYNSFFCGFTISASDNGGDASTDARGDTILPRFYAARYC
jgi:hypothetical protein